ncbi:MAG TPA: hypothetical protein VFS21_13535 [Roseiflexaceae bacterium]|nr:hypothetical protein [Roseiflexaceae bacterium]
MSTTATSWLTAGIAALLALALGAFGFFTLLIGLNGYSDSAGGTILAAYVVLALVAAVLAVLGSRWTVVALTERTGWSVWVSAILTLFGSGILVGGLLIVGSMILLLVMPSR